MRKELGKIESVRFGIGGYQESRFGLWLMLSGKGWGVVASVEGGWATTIKHSESCKWTEAERADGYAKMCYKINEILQQARVNNIQDLRGVPVEVEFEGLVLKSWRVLEEVL